MTDRDLRRLSRSELLELLIDQTEEVDRLTREVRLLKQQLESRRLTISKAGSIAEASLQINGVFEAVQAAAEQYLENVYSISAKEQALASEDAEVARKRSDEILEAARREADEIVENARQEADAYWKQVSEKLEAFYAAHHDLKELMDRPL